MRDTADGCCMYCALPQDETVGPRCNEEQRGTRFKGEPSNSHRVKSGRTERDAEDEQHDED